MFTTSGPFRLCCSRLALSVAMGYPAQPLQDYAALQPSGTLVSGKHRCTQMEEESANFFCRVPLTRIRVSFECRSVPEVVAVSRRMFDEGIIPDAQH